MFDAEVGGEEGVGVGEGAHGDVFGGPFPDPGDLHEPRADVIAVAAGVDDDLAECANEVPGGGACCGDGYLLAEDTKAGGLRGGSGAVEAHVVALGDDGWAAGTAVHAGGGDGDEELPV